MKRIAMIMHGGVAPPHSNLVVPAITALVQRLAEQFDITVYTCVKADGFNTPFMCGRAHVRYLHARAHDPLPGIVARAVYRVRKDHEAQSYDLVHGLWALPGGLAAVLAGMATGVKSVVSLLGGEAADIRSISYGNLRRAMPRRATLYTARHASAVTFLTNYQLDHLRSSGFKRKENVSVIPFGADPGIFPFVAQRPEAPPYHLLSVGHLNSVKDQRTLLRAFRRIRAHKDCRLRIIGEGSERRSLEQLAHELGIAHSVTCEGFVPHKELSRHFAWAHLLLHTSLYEGQGVVFAEAAASGVPVCSTRVGLPADLGDSFAATVHPGDDSALAECALHLLDNFSRREELTTHAHAWARDHDADWSAARFAALYDSTRGGQTLIPPAREKATGDGSGRTLGTSGNPSSRAASDTLRSATVPHTWDFVCPSCRQPLLSVQDGWQCVRENIRFGTEEGIPDFILPHRREVLERFLQVYRRVRKEEGWGSARGEYYRDLPCCDRSGRHRRIWGIRSATYRCFQDHLLQHAGGRDVSILDIGAGNCWLARRLADQDFHVCALDINLDPVDGLRALESDGCDRGLSIRRVRADFDALPFGSGTFDIALFNASLHYSSDVLRTLSHTMRLLKKGGLLYVLDSPIYRSEEAGHQMVREREERISSLLSVALPDECRGSFLTLEMLEHMKEAHHADVLTPRYGMRWAMRPLTARMLLRREPASFNVIVVPKD